MCVRTHPCNISFILYTTSPRHHGNPDLWRCLLVFSAAAACVCVRVSESNNSMCCNYRCTRIPQTPLSLSQTTVTLNLDFCINCIQVEADSLFCPRSGMLCSSVCLSVCACVCLRSVSLRSETVYHDRGLHHSSPPHLMIPLFVIGLPRSLFCFLFIEEVHFSPLRTV